MAPVEIDALPGGTCVLISGPSMTGTYDLLCEFLAGAGDASIAVSTKHDAERLRADVSAAGGPSEGRFGVVDCVSQQRDLGAVTDSATTKYVPSPENLTRVGVQFTQLFDDFHGEYADVHVGLHSLSGFLMYSDVQRVYRFLQVLTGKVSGAGWTGAAVVDPGMFDDQTVFTLQDLFDGVVETRRVDGDREYRTVGLAAEPSEWTAF